MSIQSYNLENQARDVTQGFEYLRNAEPTLFGLAKAGEVVTNRYAEWINKSMGVTYVDVSEVSGLQVTVPDGTKFAVGMELSPEATADNYIVQSISANVLTVAKANSGMANPAVGKYEVSNGGVLENATTGPQVAWSGVPSGNYVQIFRQDAELTALAEGTRTYDGASNMDVQEAEALTKLYHDINKNMWKGYKKAGSTIEAGRMGGLYEFCSALQVAGGGKAVSKALINQALALVADNGGKPNFLVCNRAQIGALNDLYENQIIVAQGDDVRGTYVSKIRNPYFPDGIINIVVDNMCPTKDIWFVDSNKIEWCFHDRMPLESVDTTPNGFIGERRTVSCAGTAKFYNPDQAFVSIRGLK